MDLIGPRISGRVRIVNDGPISHELSDDVRQLSGVREVDGVSGTVDDNEDNAVVNLLRHLLDTCSTWQQGVTASGNDH